MPIITCDIRLGRTKKQRSQLAMGLTQAVHEIAGVPIDYIFLVMREMPGFNFVDAGQHVPDYVPGPDGQDLAGHEQLRKRAETKSASAT
jgi:phenylpyruvate tautomerase PptA (4-oxalocrotonate tautomerase family)